MKKLIYIILCIWASVSEAQVTNSSTPPSGTVQSQTTTRLDGNYPLQYLGQYGGLYRWYYPLTTATNQFPFTITKPNFTVGLVVNSFADLVADITQEPQPNASLTPATVTFERTAASSGSTTFNYSYSKNTGNTNFQTAGITSSAGGTTPVPVVANGASGTSTVSFPSNTSTTFTFTVTTLNQSRSATATTRYSDRIYYGRSATATPDQAALLAFAGGGNTLTFPANKSGTFVIVASGTNYPFFAYPSSLGVLTSIKDANGLEAFTSYNTGTIDITNALGATVNYRYYIAQNATSGNTTMVTQ